MALKPEDKKLVKLISDRLRIAENQQQYSSNSGTVNIDGRDHSIIERPRVVVTKNDLRNASGRKHVRVSYQREFVKELNSEWGVNAYLDGNRIYAESRPIQTLVPEAMSLAELSEIEENEE